MSIKYLYIIMVIMSVINVCVANTQWSRKVFLLNNIFLFLVTLSFWVFYNKMLGVLQFAWGFKIAIPNFTHHLLFGLNGLSMFFLILTVFLSCICLFLNFEKPYKYNDFNFLLWILQIILVLFFTTTDLVIFFTCFELSLIPIFLIILIWGSSVRRVLASYYFYVYTGLGAVLMIIGICLIVFECGTTNMLILQLHKFNGHKQIMLFFFFFWGFAIKIPMFPFHLWLP